MTVAMLELQFRIAEMDGRGRVRGFRAKPRREHWVGGGFWESMETFEAAVLLNDIWSAGSAPCRIWD